MAGNRLVIKYYGIMVKIRFCIFRYQINEQENDGKFILYFLTNSTKLIKDLCDAFSTVKGESVSEIEFAVVRLILIKCICLSQCEYHMTSNSDMLPD